MRDDRQPPDRHDPLELEFARYLIEYTCLARDDAGRFARDYRETRDRFWALLLEPVDLRFFGSDFFDDLLAITAHPDLARDAPREAGPVLRRVGELRALRRLQGGDVAGGLRALLELGGADPAALGAAPIVDASPGVRPLAEPVLTPALLEHLAYRLHEHTPAGAQAVRELVPLLAEDPTGGSGPRLDIVFHCSAADARHHPGYGVVAVLEIEPEALDRTDRSVLRIGGVRMAANAPFAAGVWDAIRGASVASRAAGGPDLLRGIDLGFRIHGIPGHPTGESASLAFALLGLWVAGCTWSRKELEPPPGSAAIGIVHADGSVHEVFAGALPAKLRRLRESGVRRLYVPESQRRTCEELLQEAPSGGDPTPILERRIEVLGVDPLGRALAVEAGRKPLGRWLLRRARRHRLPILLGSSFLLLLVIATMLLELRIELRAVRRDGNVLTATYRWGRPRTVQLGKAPLLAPPAIAEPKRVDLDGDDAPEVVVVSMEVSGPNARQGRVRVDVLDRNLEVLWTRFVDAPLGFPGDDPSAAPELTPELFDVEDWNGDGRAEIFVVANGLYFPSCTCVWDAAGRAVGRFVNAGHVKALVLVPGAGSRRDLVLFGECAETRGCMVARLPAEFGDGAFPGESARTRLENGPPAPPGALFLEILPALPRLFEPRAQIWPGSLAWLGPALPRLQISTLEFAPSGALLRQLDAELHQVAVTATTAFVNDWRHRPDGAPAELGGADVTRAIETVRRWEAGVWREERLPAWNPSP